MTTPRRLAARRQYHSQAPQRAQAGAARRAQGAADKLIRLAERPAEVVS